MTDQFLQSSTLGTGWLGGGGGGVLKVLTCIIAHTIQLAYYASEGVAKKEVFDNERQRPKCCQSFADPTSSNYEKWRVWHGPNKAHKIGEVRIGHKRLAPD